MSVMGKRLWPVDPGPGLVDASAHPPQAACLLAVKQEHGIGCGEFGNTGGWLSGFGSSQSSLFP